MSKILIDAKHNRTGINWKELYQYKDLFWLLAYRDFRVRYAQTILGLLWGIIQPVATLLVFILVFGKIVSVNSGKVPYSLFALAGMVLWSYFAFVLNQAGNSIISAQGMIKKIYFPRLVIPLSKALVGLIDFSITSIFLIGLMVYFQFVPSVNILWAPIFVLLTIIAALGVGIWLSALTIRYRDFQHIVPFLVQFGLYATPVGYPASIIINNSKLPEIYKIMYFLNPMAGLIEGFRKCLFGGEIFSINYIYISIIVSILLFISSLVYFRKVESIMADIV